jgi:hypothetical protein
MFFVVFSTMSVSLCPYLCMLIYWFSCLCYLCCCFFVFFWCFIVCDSVCCLAAEKVFPFSGVNALTFMLLQRVHISQPMRVRFAQVRECVCVV